MSKGLSYLREAVETLTPEDVKGERAAITIIKEEEDVYISVMGRGIHLVDALKEALNDEPLGFLVAVSMISILEEKKATNEEAEKAAKMMMEYLKS
jgi:hypothetical protein